MFSGVENLRPGLDAPSRRLITAPEAVAPVRDAAGTGARAARGQRDAARDRGDRPPKPELMNGGSVSAPAPSDESPAPPGSEPESAGGDQHAPQGRPAGNPAGGPVGDPAGGSPAGLDQPSARRAVAVLEPELSDLMAARLAYAAGMMLIQTRGQTIPAGAVLDGTI